MIKVTFTIEGLVACYRKPKTSDFWTFVFPHDDHHTVDFTYTQNNIKTHLGSLVDKNIRVTAMPESKPSDYSTDNFNRQVLDLTHQFLHAEGLKKKKANAMMKVQYAVLDSLSQEQFPAATFKSDNQGSTVVEVNLLPEKPSNLIGGEITIPDTGTIILTIDGIANPIPLGNGDSFKINNRCEECDDDFRLYQTQLFVNKKHPKKLCKVLLVSPLKGEPPAFCDGVQISGDPSDLD